MHDGKLARGDRNQLLARMTDEVAALVLRNNYLQSQAISTLELQSTARLPEFQHLIRSLERSGELNRALEFLPTRRGAHRAAQERRGTHAPGAVDPARLQQDLAQQPPAGLRRAGRSVPVVGAGALLPDADRRSASRAPSASHRLRREIIATATTNSLVNRMGPTFVPRAQEDTGAEPAQIARAYTAAREIFDMRDVWEHIEALDNKVTANLQYETAFQTSRLLRHVTYWLLALAQRELQVDAAVAEFRDGVRQLEAEIARACSPARSSRASRRAASASPRRGLPPALAVRIASLEALNAALDIVEIAAGHRVSVAETARVYFEVGTRIGLDWLRARIEKLTVDGPWQAIARTGLRDAALRVQRRLTERVLARKDRGSAQARVSAWVEAAGKDLAHWQRTLADMRAAGASDFATLTVGVESVRKLAN